MHPHLHTKDNTGMSIATQIGSTLTQGYGAACEDIMTALEECHARGFMWKSLGMCNDSKQQVILCLRAERLKRTATNRAVAKVKREKVKKVWDDIDENS